MDAAPRTTLDLRLADACRGEHYGLSVLQAIANNAALPWDVRERADLHHVETEAQLGRLARALETLDPALRARLAGSIEPSARLMAIPDWIRLERREIAAYMDLMPYARHAHLEGLARDCASALDLQRSVLHWLESLDASAPGTAPSALRTPA
ncbi:hypothetical protein [Pseudoxanthomonas daejeonensis]|uniref:Uncharacterized protein n=1 Tax=Pseudoxanthomonas daejeonensis TaxID=266062 RepID=A0ABQ6Z6D3_9GAMM|nr:hypothetical protein [Pseudoxanthomonas daejeonensis]KAF1694100.1 hypothetical protein CSC65_10640 [Pseudoxanthomonas daejeonensis]